MCLKNAALSVTIATSSLHTDTMTTADAYRVYPVGTISPFACPTKLLTARLQDSYKSREWCLVSDSGLQSRFLLMTYPDLKYAVAIDDGRGNGGQRKTKLVNMTGCINTGQRVARPILRGTTFQLRTIVGGDSNLCWIETPYIDGADGADVVLSHNDGAVTARCTQPPNAVNIWKIERLPEGVQKFFDPMPWPA